jgi:hypothetical protein
LENQRKSGRTKKNKGKLGKIEVSARTGLDSVACFFFVLCLVLTLFGAVLGRT